MAGTTDWASDLREFHDPPKPAKDWASFRRLASSGSNPKDDPTTLSYIERGFSTIRIVESSANIGFEQSS